MMRQIVRQRAWSVVQILGLMTGAVYMATQFDIERHIRADRVTPKTQAKIKRVQEVKDQLDVAATAATGPIRQVDSELTQMLAEDELDSQNPYSELSSPVPIQEIFAKGIRGFDRRTYRSPNYHETFGYDLVTYEVRHEKSKSLILAHTSNSGIEGVPTKTFVVFISPLSEGMVRWTQFEDQLLAYDRVMSEEEATTQMSSLIQSSIPFLSVSR